MATTEEKQTYVGAPVRRKEDPELVTGQARYTDDITVTGMVWMAVVRSPHAHARIKGVDLSKARAAEGVVAAFSGEELASDWAAPLPCAWPVTEEMANPPHLPLATDKARYAGDGVAVVVAETRALAKDAAELVEVDYEPLDAVTDLERALEEGAPLVHDDVAGNRCFTWAIEGPEEGAVEQAFAAAEVTVKERYRHQRLIPNAIEPRSVLVQPVPGAGRVHDVDGDADPAHPAGHARAHARHPGGEAARDRAGGRRRLRLEARRLRRGGALPRAREAGSAARSSGRRSARRPTWRRSTGATSSRRSSWRRPPRARSPPSASR